MWVSGEWTRYIGRGKDETFYAIIKYLHGRFFLLDCRGFRGGYGEKVLTAFSNIAKDYKVNTFVVEPNFGDGMFDKLLKSVLQKAGYPVEVIDAERSSAQKERRIIDTLEPVLNQHKLVVNKSLITKDYKSTENLPVEEVNRYRLVYQLTRITKDKGALMNDDRLDAVAIGVHYWTEAMARHEKREEDKGKEEIAWPGTETTCCGSCAALLFVLGRVLAEVLLDVARLPLARSSGSPSSQMCAAIDVQHLPGYARGLC
jgi:hypothetical protein